MKKLLSLSKCDRTWTEERNGTSGAGLVLLLGGRMCPAGKQPTFLKKCLPESWTTIMEDGFKAQQWKVQ